VRSTVEPVEPTKVKINVVVEPDELGPAIDRAARRLSREVKVPGFRKGKVPRPVLEARIGRETLIAEAIEHEAVPEFYAKAVEEHGVEPLSRAKVDPPDYKDGRPLEFSATVEVKPQIDLPPYRGVEVERPELEVTDEHVDAQLDQLRERFAQLEVIGRPIAKGDFAQIDLRATRHTTEIPELTRTDFLYEVGSGTVVPQLDEQLEGARRGDILRFNATLPEAAGEQLTGQEVTFTVLVKEAKTKVLPSLDDDFAQEASEFDTLDELKADLRERLQEAAAGQVRSELETRVLQAYLDQVDVPLPQSLVSDEFQYRATRFARQLSLMGLPLARYLEGVETTEEQLEADLRAQAERAVKAQLVLEAVAGAEGMQASEEEVSAEIRRQAERLGRDPEDVRKALGGGRDSAIRGDILRSRALALLVEDADVRGPRGGGEGEAAAVGATAGGATAGPDGDEQAPKE
jgi:trigger factor